MRGVTTRGLARAGLVLALLAPTFSASPSAAAPSSASDAAISLKKAEKRLALAELERQRDELSSQVAEYVAIGRRIERTQAQMSEVTTQIAHMDGQLLSAEEALRQRVVELYRSDRLGMMDLLFGAGSIPELLDRMSYLAAANRRDSKLVTDVRLARQESLWLQESLGEQSDALIELQYEADQKRSRIESDMAATELRAAELGTDIARLLREQAQQPLDIQGGTPDTRFNPDTVISDASFRASTSMMVGDIQAFLDKQPGSLKSYRAADHNGVVKPTSQLIADAAVRWNVSPKVILVKLQKEQSLLAKPNPSQRAYDWAMGCGKADSRTFYQYQGFGKQIWFGAQKLSENAQPWKPGIEMKIDGMAVRPTNASTYSLYKYTPHFRGTMSFWMLYWRYFGDPMI